MLRIIGRCAAASLLMAASCASYAAPGQLDASFGAFGVARFDFAQPVAVRVKASAKQSDGRILLVGDTTAPDGLDHVMIGRLNGDGTLDTSYGTAGWVTLAAPNANLSCASVGIGSAIVVGGIGAVAVAKCGATVALFRVTEMGNPDASFGPDGNGIIVDAASAQLTPRTMLVDAGGSIYIAGGTRTTALAPFNSFVKRYLASGAADASFGSAGVASTSFGSADDEILAIAVAPDNRILAAGYAQQNGGPKTVLVTRFATNGALTTFGLSNFVTFSINGEGDSAHAIAPAANGRIVVAGRAGNSFMGGPQQGLFFVFRFGSDGFFDTSFGGGSGRIVLDMPVNSPHDADATATAINVLQSDWMYVGGVATKDGISHLAFACVNPIGNLEAGCGNAGRFLGPVGSDSDVLVGSHLAGDFAHLAIGRRMTSGGDRVLVARFNDGDADPSFGDGGSAVYMPFTATADQVNDVALQSDGRILVAAVGPSGTSRLARLDPAGQLDSGFGRGGIVDLAPFGAQMRGAYALAVQPDGRILVASTAWLANYNPPRDGYAITRLNADGSLDTTWNAFGHVIGDEPIVPAALAVQASGKVLFLGKTPLNGGRFFLMRMNGDGGGDTTFVLPFGSQIVLDRPGILEESPQALAVHPSDPETYYAVGYTKSPFGSVNMIAYRLFGAQIANQVVMDFGTPSVANGIAIQSDGKAVLAGACGSGVANSCFARIDAFGNLDPTFGQGGIAQYPLATGSDRAIGVHATPLGGIAAGADHEGGLGAVALDAQGRLDPSFNGSGYNLAPLPGVAAASALQPDGKIVVAGTIAGGGRSGWVIARFDGADQTPLDTLLEVAPASSPTSQNWAIFTFTSTKPGSTFECSFEGGPFFGPCWSPASVGGLSDGEHVFAVRARDGAGNVDPTPASRTWVVDTIAPSVQITGAPSGVSGLTVTLTFTSDDASATFMCVVPGMPDFSACASPLAVTLPPGTFSATFAVYAVDAAGNRSMLDVRQWSVDSYPPYAWISSGPQQPVEESATFTLEASEPGVTFECRVDAGAFAPCASPVTISGLMQGWHQLTVRATDAVGNVGQESGPFSWYVLVSDRVPDPFTFTDLYDVPPNLPMWSNVVQITGIIDPAPVTVQGGTYSLGCSGFFTADPGWIYNGQYICVQHVTAPFPGMSVDTVLTIGGVSDTFTSRTADGPPLDTLLTSFNRDTPDSARIGFEATVPGATFECSLNGAPFSPCPSPVAYSGLGEGDYNFLVRAKLGTAVDTTPARLDWTIDLTPPTVTLVSGPSGTVASTTATFEFFASPGATIVCALDGANLQGPCGSPKTYSGLAQGAHTFTVVAFDDGGVGPALVVEWSVDSTAPDTFIGSGPSPQTNSQAPTFTFSSDDPAATFACSLDGGAFVACTSPASYMGVGEGAHTFEARAIDAHGNADPTTARHVWTVDLTAPDSLILSGPPEVGSATAVTFTFQSTEPGVTFQCGVNVAGEACTSPKTFTGLADASYRFVIQAIDGAGNTGPASVYWFTIDTARPDTLITSGPAGAVSSSSATFTFAATELNAVFDCRLDGGAFAACASPVTYSGLAQGEHQFVVVARDLAGNFDATAAQAVWTVDSVAPDTAISSGPAANTTSSTATFSFVSNEPGAAFECRLEGGPWTACASPRTYPGIPDGGPHVFEVRSVDAAGNVDATPAIFSWMIDTVAPQTAITSGIAGTVATTSATHTFISDDPAAAFECRIDAEPFVACTSPNTRTGLAGGAHTFEVRAVDPFGNRDASPALGAWTIDVAAPETTIGTGPSGAIASTSASFAFSSSESDSTFQCKLDAGAFSACTSPRSYAALAQGSHTFQVRAADALGNQDATPASRTWTVDTVAPTTTIVSGPPSPTSSTSATFTFTSNEAGATFECKLDAAAFAPCASPTTYTGLSRATHTVQVRARDAAGNLDSSPASTTWRVR